MCVCIYICKYSKKTFCKIEAKLSTVFICLIKNVGHLKLGLPFLWQEKIFSQFKIEKKNGHYIYIYQMESKREMK